MKIIASDYDGTLNQRGISDRVREAILHWQALGNKFGIVSGRGILNILGVVKRDAMKCDFLIANNGAIIADGEGNVLSHHTGDASVSGRIAAFILENGGRYACLNDLTGDRFVCSDREKQGNMARDERFIAISDYDSSIAFTQISTVCESESDAEGLTEKINLTFAEWVAAFQNGICIDVVPRGIDKATGIRELSEIYGVAYEDVCTVGDNHNDIAMLKAYRSYAVENAIAVVKNIANSVVADIAELIEKELTL